MRTSARKIWEGLYPVAETGLGCLPHAFPELGIQEKLAEMDRMARQAGDESDYPNDFADSRGQFLSALGLVFAETLVHETGWEIAWVRREGEGIEDGVLSVVDKQRRYLLEPIAMFYSYELSDVNGCQSIYEKITNGLLPEVPAESFFQIRP